MSDPETSKQAGESVTEMRASHARVKNMFVLYGDLHDKALTMYLNAMEKNAGLKPMSPSGVRSRRNELAKPNMDRLDAIKAEMGFGPPLNIGDGDEAFEQEARRRLRAEGFKSPLWDTGKREIVDGRTVIVWGLAR